MQVCRQAGYFEHASNSARKYERHEEYLRIRIEDARNFGEGLGYLGAEAVSSTPFVNSMVVGDARTG
jgi:vacuolar protein sorting-associated protein 11